MYKLWDDFGIADSWMLRLLHSKNPVKTDNKNVLVTVYPKNSSALLCVYNFSGRAEKFKLEINNELLGFKPGIALKCALVKKQKGKNIYKNYRLGKRKGPIIELNEG